MTTILRSPREASAIFSLSGPTPPRHRNLFVVKFTKGASTATTGTKASAWVSELGFMVKSVDRPTVEAKVEELNQYNKKRLVTTGYKIGPTRLTLYDTADSMAMQMFAEYASYYYGDFRHAANPLDWSYDATQSKFNDSGGGFGFAPQASSSNVSDLSAPFFFDSISIYQVYGGEYVQFDLINPRITSFDPDELDYQNSDVNTISMVIQCEAVLYKNNHAPQPLAADAYLSTIFTDVTSFDGDVLDLPSNESSDPSVAYSYPPVAVNFPDLLASAALSVAAPARTYASTISGGALNTFGTYNFGSSVASNVTTPNQGLSVDLSQSAITNPLLATALNLSAATLAGIAPNNGDFINPATIPTSISQATYDQARAAVQAAGLDYGRIDNAYIADTLVYGAIAAGLAAGGTAREQIYNRQTPVPQNAAVLQRRGSVRQYAGSVSEAPTDAPVATARAAAVPQDLPNEAVDVDASTVRPLNSWDVSGGRGLALSTAAYGILNAQRSATSQIGFNQRSTGTNAPRRPLGQGSTTPKGF